MELQYFGANCIRIATKKAQIVVDDNLDQLGLKSITKPTDISLYTSPTVPPKISAFTANMPGEYEVSGVVIHGIATRSYGEDANKKSSTMYTITAEDIRVVILGHIYPDLSEAQLEAMGHIDVAVVPVGNANYTLDGEGALQVIKKIEPRVVIPTHYADKGIKYEVAQAELAVALKKLAMEPSEPVDRYKPKLAEMTDTTHLVVLKRQ